MVVEGHQGPAVVDGGQQQHHVAVEHNQVQHKLGDTKVEALGEGRDHFLSNQYGYSCFRLQQQVYTSHTYHIHLHTLHSSP